MIFYCKLYRRTGSGLKELGSTSVRAVLGNRGVSISPYYAVTVKPRHQLVQAVATSPDGPWRTNVVPTPHYLATGLTVTQEIEILL